MYTYPMNWQRDLPSFPPLQPTGRGREFNQYSLSDHREVVYHYLFNGLSHRALDRDILGLDPSYSRGYQSWSILRFLGLLDEHKHFFEGCPIDDALRTLKPYTNEEAYLLIYSYLLDKAEMYQEDRQAEYGVAELDARYWVNQFLKDVHDRTQIDDRLGFIPASSQEFRYGTSKYYVSSPTLKEVLKCRYDFYCQVCNTRIYRPKWVQTLPIKEQWKHLNADVHHIRPLSQGGSDLMENMLCLCPNCHRRFHTEEHILKKKEDHLFAFNQISGKHSPLTIRHTIYLTV